MPILNARSLQFTPCFFNSVIKFELIFQGLSTLNGNHGFIDIFFQIFRRSSPNIDLCRSSTTLSKKEEEIRKKAKNPILGLLLTGQFDYYGKYPTGKTFIRVRSILAITVSLVAVTDADLVSSSIKAYSPKMALCQIFEVVPVIMYFTFSIEDSVHGIA